MALNNSQYDEIFRSYDAKQLKAQHQLEERTKAAYERSPELKALDASIAEISVASARRLLDGDSSALTELKAELKNLRTRKKALMKELSLPENYFEPVYECPDCKDTGYIDGKPCHCFKQQKQQDRAEHCAGTGRLFRRFLLFFRSSVCCRFGFLFCHMDSSYCSGSVLFL